MQRSAPLEFVASVVTGVVSLSKTLEDGRIQTVGLLLASDFIGRPERVAIDFDFTATTDVVLCCFQRANFKAMLDCTPHLSHRLLDYSKQIRVKNQSDLHLVQGCKRPGFANAIQVC